MADEQSYWAFISSFLFSVFVFPLDYAGPFSVVPSCLPEAERAVAGGELGRDHEASALEIEQHFAPGLGALPVAVGDRQQLLAAHLVGADDHQDALLVVIEPW